MDLREQRGMELAATENHRKEGIGWCLRNPATLNTK